ncbi:MAG: transcription elongation factor GreA [Lachnospiraceae bacterium]|nr:transcription elongation factor GreA [Lachnospiraceae bacterium]
MADVKNVISREGYEKLVEELQDLKVNGRKQVTDKIKEAKSQGDLSENAEYSAAKEEQSHIEGRIVEIEELLKTLEVINEDEIDSKKVNIGLYVKLRDVDLEQDVEYQIVGSTEADILNGKISNESPVGAALMGKKKNAVVDVETPTGDFIKYKILSISKKKKK